MIVTNFGPTEHVTLLLKFSPLVRDFGIMFHMLSFMLLLSSLNWEVF